MCTLVLKEQLFQKSFEYVYGIIDLRELEEWLLPNLETILDSADDRSSEIAQLIEWGAIEVQADLCSAEELSEALRNLLFASIVRSPGIQASGILSSAIESQEDVWDIEVPGPRETIRWELQFSSSERERSRQEVF